VSELVGYEREGALVAVTINRPARRNAVDRATAMALADAFRTFDRDEDAAVAILTGSGGHFCAGADLKAIADGEGNRVEPSGDGPMGPTRMLLSKPVIAAVEGYAVAGGLELALWCDLRVAARSARFGVLCRRWGVPLIDGGTVRLPRVIGHGRALDMILTGREVDAEEAAHMGLVNYLADDGGALDKAREIANAIATHPARCMREDRLSSYEQWSLSLPDAMAGELTRGMQVLSAPDFAAGVERFTKR
jgi:enoyl-CoA hydratase